ncbi:DUF3021 domain-containing protein [Varibaculum cambriense]|uniref:DUF3021 domain-containing protein n=1 Tax=Varibaculum cambriense TaxID=184870 RepID=UPI0003B73A58|nr:DUF3021 domain-containing protein [Varibaculum cambriense]MDU4244904.1 DUF3021 domain-containing protein [Varibaculum cambriense]MDU5315711.1 DUF3021 domain-containing protein [Varibaculum cambriense]
MKTKKIVGLTLVGACIGIIIGTSIELIFSSLSSSSYYPGAPEFLNTFGNENVAVLIERLIYAAYGIIGSFAGLLYRNETRPLILNTAIHFGIILICGIAAGSYLKWWGSSFDMIGVIITIALIYLLIWLFNWLMARAEVKKMNQKLQ